MSSDNNKSIELKLSKLVDCERIITDLQGLRFQQSAFFEEVFYDFSRMSELLRKQSIKPRIRIGSPDVQASSIRSVSENGIVGDESFTQSSFQLPLLPPPPQQLLLTVEEKIFAHHSSLKEKQDKIQSIAREIKDLKEESKMKSQMFENEILERIAAARSMPFSRITVPKSVSQYVYDTLSGALVIAESDEPCPLLRISQIISKPSSPPSLSSSIPANSQQFGFAFISMINNIIAWTCENSEEVEVWTIAQSLVKRRAIIRAHSEKITAIAMLDERTLITCSAKNIAKIWQIDDNQDAASTAVLLKAIKLDASITCVKRSQLKRDNQTVQFIAGFSNGFVRVLIVSMLTPHTTTVSFEVQLPIKQPATENTFIDCLSVTSDLTLIAASIASDPENIYIISTDPSTSTKMVSIKDARSQKQYRNSSSKKQFTITSNALIAGSFDGQIYLWLINQPSKITLKSTFTTLSTAQILIAAYDDQDNTLITGDEQGNVLKWDKFLTQ